MFLKPISPTGFFGVFNIIEKQKKKKKANKKQQIPTTNDPISTQNGPKWSCKR